MWKLLTDAVAKVVPFGGPHIDPAELAKLQLAEQTFDAAVAEFDRRREQEKNGDPEPKSTSVDAIAATIRDDECFEMKGGFR